MQLTDDEIREILRREKRRKRRKQQQRRRLVLLILIIIIIAVALFIRFYPGKSEPAPAEEAARGVIFIDPGHGGDDPGSDNGARFEKEDTLKLSLAVRTYLEGDGFDVYITRTDDSTVERSARAKMANDCNAQLMVSIHRNDADGKGEGVEAYIPKEDTQESRLLAENIIRALAAEGFARREIRAGTLNDPASDYEELSGLNMPGCLLEVGFISSMDDNKLFDKNLDENARAIAAAIESTFTALHESAPSEASPADGEQAGEEPAGSEPDGAKG